MPVRLFNTLTRSIDDFEPLVPPRVTFYMCGPTVWNYAHIGNFRTFLFGDLLRRFLEYEGFDVFMVMNLTDVDDRTITAAHEGESVVVRVIDDGPGIPPDVKSRIFDPFFTTKPVGAGTGLGLDVAQRLVDRHDGLIAVTSEPGRTEFQVTLPVTGTKVG